MRRSRRGCTTAVSENQMAEQSVMRQTTETQPDPKDLKGRRAGGAVDLCVCVYKGGKKNVELVRQ